MLRTEYLRIDPAYRERLRACGLDDVRRVLARVDGDVTAWSRTTETLYVPGADGTPGFYIKRHYFSRWAKRLRGTLRGTFLGADRGRAEYLALHRMRALGIPAVRPVAYGGQRVLHFLSACFLITEEVPDAENLTSFALDVAAGRRRLSHPARLLLLHTLAEQLRALHTTGFAHGNLFWRNILVRYGPDGVPEFFYLDPQPPHTWERVGAAGGWSLRELAQMSASALPFTSRSERLHFLRHYYDVRPLPAQARTDARAIERLAQEWRLHEDRRIRMTGLFSRWSAQLADEQRRESTLPAEQLS